MSFIVTCHAAMSHHPTSAVLQVWHSPCWHSTHCHADAHPSRECHAARDAGQVSPCVNCNIKCKGCHGIREVSHCHSSAHLLHDCHEPCDALREHHQPSIQQNDVRCQNWEEQNSIFASRNSEMERSLLLYHKNRLKMLLAIHQCVIVGNSPWPPGWCWWAQCARSLNTINWTLMYNFLHVRCGTRAGCWTAGLPTGAAVHFGKLSTSRLIKYQIICQWSNLSKLFCAENLCSLNQSLLCIYSETHYRYLWKIASKYSSVHCPRVRHM